MSNKVTSTLELKALLNFIFHSNKRLQQKTNDKYIIIPKRLLVAMESNNLDLMFHAQEQINICKEITSFIEGKEDDFVV
jgi:uncharacterized protein (UPF0333 family)